VAESIRDTIKKLSEEAGHVDQLGPHRVSEILVELSSLMASLNSYLVEKQYWLNVKRQELLTEHKTVAKARLMADSTEEWKAWMEGVYQREALLELLRALKYYLRNSADEKRESIY